MIENTLIIVPVYNCEDNIASVLSNLPKEHTLVINDGSSDSSEEVITRMNFDLISHQENLGVGAALKTGIKYGLSKGYTYCITIDADGQHNPRFVKDFYLAVQESDFVIGNRFANYKEIPDAKLASNFLASYIIDQVFGTKLYDVACGFRAFRLSEDLLEIPSNGFGFLYTHLLNTISNKHTISSVNIDCIYPTDKLYSSPKLEITGFIHAMSSYITDDKTLAKLQKIQQHFNASKSFSFKFEDVEIYAFYLKEYLSYLIQIDKIKVSEFYKEVW